MPEFSPLVTQEIEALARELAARFTPPEYHPGCQVKDTSDKDLYAANNGWIEAVVNQHNQQRVRYRGAPPGVGTVDFVDVIYFPDRKLFEVYGQGGTVSPRVGVLNNFAGTAAPGVSDDSGGGYAVGSQWVDVTNDNSYILVDATAGSANWEQTNGSSGSGKNLLYHSVSNNIYQSGTSSSDHANDEYFADIVNVLHNASTTGPTLSRVFTGGIASNYNIRCAIAENSTKAAVMQFLMAEDAQKLRGQTVSFSADITGSNIPGMRMAILEWTGTADSINSDFISSWASANPTLFAGWAYANTPSLSFDTTSGSKERFAVEGIQLSGSVNNLAAMIWTAGPEDSGDYFDVGRLKLEVGEKATDFDYRLLEDELPLVQQFYINLPSSSTTISYGYNQSTSQMRGFIPLPVTMWATPTVLGTPGDFSIRSNGVVKTVTSADTIRVEPNGLRIFWNDSTAGLTAFHAAAVLSTGALELDARL